MVFGGGSGVANVMALAALMFSGYSYYETVWKGPDLRLFTPGVIEFADPSNGPFDVFAIPVTITNLGARAGVALSMDLEVFSPETGETKRYYAAEVGSWREAYDGDGDAFAPLSIGGGEAISESILFYPRAEEEIDRHISTEGGVYAFRLTLNAAAADRTEAPFFGDSEDAVSLEFEMRIDGLDYRAFNEGGTLRFRRPDYAASASR